MKKNIIAVISALMLIAVFSFSSCSAGGRVDDNASRARRSEISSSDRRSRETSDVEDKISEGLSNAGQAVRDGVSDVSEAASDIADDIRDDMSRDETSTNRNN